MTTVREALAHALRALAEPDGSTQIPPAAVLWPDPDRLWTDVVPSLHPHVPVLTLGTHDPGAAQGPAIWLRAVVAQLDGPDAAALGLPDQLAQHGPDSPWVFYLPGIGRDAFSDLGGLHRDLEPLAELQLRSRWWLMSNQQPWTPASFLRSKEGLGIDVAQDAATRDAIAQALGALLDEEVDALHSGPRLDAARLHGLVVTDPVRTLLSWIDDPTTTRNRLTASGEWKTFAALCADRYSVDPSKATPITAAEHLGRRVGEWSTVWNRFAESPTLYPHLPETLDKARPAGQLFGSDDPHPDSWPSWNLEQEDALRTGLLDLSTAPTLAAARQGLQTLAADHGSRRNAVWAELGRAPLASALDHLAKLAGETATSPIGDTAAQALWYRETGSRVDDLALLARAAVSAEADRTAVATALHAVYDPWLDDVARSFQQAATTEYPGAIGLATSPGTCVVFVDALRMDLGHRLSARLAATGHGCVLDHRLAAFPTVTPTGQPAVAPVDQDIAGWGAGPGLAAGDAQGHAVAGAVFRAGLKASGVQYLDWSAGETGEPSGVGWTQTNAIDSLGHGHGALLPGLLDAQLATVAERVSALLTAGWRRVVVVTDHGFQLPAAPAAKTELPLHLTDDATRKPRVARIKPGQSTSLPTVPWTWDPSVMMASAPGASAFEAGTRYEHGGLSPQECVTPVLTVTAGGATSAVEAAIEGLKWTGQRCRVDVSPTDASFAVEVRTAPGDPHSVVGGPKDTRDGEAKVLVADDTLEGRPAYVVLLDADGTVVAQRETTIGGD